MRLKCPNCGWRDIREFTYMGAALMMERPAADAPIEEWDAYLHLRDNPDGVTRELWYHEYGCGAWLVVTRNTLTHEVIKCELAEKVAAKAAKKTAGAAS
ncbi:MAG: sarcosine oxidase subunit delta [Pseudomonadota bacterium]